MESEERKEYQRKWYLKKKEDHKFVERKREYSREYQRLHKKELNDKQKEYYRENNKKWRENNPNYMSDYYKNNKDKWKLYADKNEFVCVYKLINENNEVIRYGSTKNLKQRILNYFTGLSSPCVSFDDWFNKYDLCKVEYILVDDRELAYNLEYSFIDAFKPKLNEKENKSKEQYKDLHKEISNNDWQEFDISRYKAKVS